MKKKQKVQKPPIASKRTPSSKASTALTDSSSKWIRIDRPFAVPPYVKEALQRLDEAGHIAYVVGGSVRDFLLERESKDHDIATSATPEEMEKLFPAAITVGKAFGVLKIPIQASSGAQFLEIATFREDLEYRDHRHPLGVKFSGPIEDARRRDFTINALYYDFKSSRILDTVHGIDDLRAKLVRAIGDPMERFREDALRLLRAIRFTTTLGFTLDDSTGSAIRDRARLISRVSAERIRDELTLMLRGPDPRRALELLAELGLLKLVLPEIDALKGLTGEVWRHTLKLLACVTEQNSVRSEALAWGALLHDVGKPVAARRSGGKNFNGHEIDAGKLVFSIGTRLKMPRAEIDRIMKLVEDQLKFKDAFQMREATLQRFISQAHFAELLALHRADATVTDGNLAYYEFCESRWKELKRSTEQTAPKLIDGTDLIQLGLEPGPEFAGILRTIEDLAIEHQLSTKEEALEYVIKHFVK